MENVIELDLKTFKHAIKPPQKQKIIKSSYHVFLFLFLLFILFQIKTELVNLLVHNRH
jgi:hypothetical protein